MRKFTPILIAWWVMGLSVFAGPRDAQWKLVDDAVKKGLPRTAITNLEPIIQGARKDKAYAEAVKAIGRKVTLEGTIEGNKPEEKITRLEAERAKAPQEIVPMLDTLLGHWYWHYYQQNKWRFMQRTATAAAPGKDFTTWDLPRLFAEIDKQFQRALAAEKFLKATPVQAWGDLLEKGTMPDAYRPTLYDFVGHEALQFYSSGEQAAAKAEESFELSADSPVLDSAQKFLAWKPGTAADRTSSVLKAIGLYQALLRFHQADPPPALAFADVDLERLAWGWNTAFGEEKNARYKAALEAFISAHADFEIAARAYEHEARVWQQENDLAAAHKLAQRGAQLFTQSPGGKLCRNLVNEIEAKSASIVTERVWNCYEGREQRDDCPAITVHYRNVEAVYFRAVPYDWETFLQKRHNRPESLSLEERRAVLAKSPALEWSEKLPSAADYQEKTLEVQAPSRLKPGFYFIIASHDPSFRETENMVSMADVWVSDLALVTRTRDSNIEGFLLEAGSGEPIKSGELNVWHLDNQGNRVADPSLTTDENGFFTFKPAQNLGYLLRARHQGREVATVGDLAAYDWQYERRLRPEGQTVFFLDRSIYRPGQTIQYKGLAIWVDQSKDNYEPLKDENLTVVLKDVNGKEVQRQKHRANDYGSFAGSFTAPRGGLLGQMTLQVDGRARGSAAFRVEEYKRPKFEVTLDAPKTAAKLKERVNLTGHAMGYTGAAVDGAQVNYHVIREVRMPWWWGWYGRGLPQTESQEIAHGTARTETDGSFKIEFLARPDPKTPEKDEPTFVFEVNADVTDSTGETRSANRGIRVGYTALEALLSANDWQTEDQAVQLRIETKTLDGEPQVAEGNVKVFELQAPEKVQRVRLVDFQYGRYGGEFGSRGNPGNESARDLSDPNNWPLGKMIKETGFTTDTNGAGRVSLDLPTGAYRAMLETQDRFGKKVTGRLPVQVLKPGATRLAIRVPHLLAAPQWETQPGEEFMALWGTGYDEGRAFVEIEHRNGMLQRFWTESGQTQRQIKLAVTEAMRGGFTLHVTQVRQNRGYLESRRVGVPWKNKELDLKWEHFVSKLQPGAKETWSLRIQSTQTNAPSFERKIAELVATLYDESLDAFAPHHWIERFNFFREDVSTAQTQFGNLAAPFQHIFGGWQQPYQYVSITYRSFPPDLTANMEGYAFHRSYGRSVGGLGGGPAEPAASLALAENSMAKRPGLITPLSSAAASLDAVVTGGATDLKRSSPQPNLANVTPRKNLNETAFFFPQLTSDSNGVVRMTFTMPEALSKWRFMAFAHDSALRSGYLDGHTVTAKDLMVQPNPPRFLREGDAVEFTVKVSNQSDAPQTGTVRLTFNTALNDQSADKLLGNIRNEKSFTIPPKESRSFSWPIEVPDGIGFLTYKAVAATTAMSDGEEGAVPVLSRRILVTESLPLPIRGPVSKNFEFTKLLKSGSSKTLQHESLTVQMVSNPAWYAVLALPYLMEYPHECSEQIFNRLYANALARSIATSDPKIHKVFEQWRNTPALDSPLQKNQDLKAVMIEETPWLRQADSESQARRNVGILFDDNRLNSELDATLAKLTQMQLGDGLWPWFPGGRGNDYITLYIVTGFGRLRHLGVDVTVAPAVRSLQRLDAWMTESYNRIQQYPQPEKYVPSATDALYLYGRSFFLKDAPIAAPNKPAVEFFLKQARKFWLETNSRQTQGHLAIALKRFATAANTNDNIPAAIMKSIKERSVSNEEMGMFWRDTELSWWWYHAPIETQALMIEAFDEVVGDRGAVEECRVWLLKQKQTQDWKTTKATADAVYALLLKGRDLLASDALVEVKLAGQDVREMRNAREARPGTNEARTQPEAGTGFYEVHLGGADVKPKFGEITVKKVDQGVAWGSVHWQYFEDISKVTPYEGTPLKLNKSLFKKVNTAAGKTLEAVKGPVSVGDELVVRIELRVDRDMEYVHLKDQRGSGTEPVNVLSQYKYQDGLAYYESTRDTASHFFIDYLPKGVYVFEYSTRVQLRGQYQTGIAQIQCMYAPEFNSHSQSLPLVVK